MSHRLGDGPSDATGGWAGEYTSPDGLIKLVVDEEEMDWHIDARPGHSPVHMRTVLAQARARGMEPMDADECEPELLEDGTVRIYLVFSGESAVVVQPATPTAQEERRTSAAKRMTLTFALVACVAGALLTPSPLHHDYPLVGNEHQSDTADKVIMDPGTASTITVTFNREDY
ncbi:hypothetical protein PBI_PAEDORE_30 [Streptomyces phage Paedore]|uniref:Uncharacterized protein n=1 Tax=Streptomyces phage Paedore TaxID=2108134 RepID=A0A2P1JTQ7_9CAUD|nr:hypothetical protein KGG91_gp30 [Streptomyces phage Paedore]AVO22513.1 hypothetical protein PBI_PAEDORE_30 [Streptomyces phage Paedore]